MTGFFPSFDPSLTHAVAAARRLRRMRFGLDVAQQRMPWDEVVSRVQFAEELGFDGAWGFDHFQPMYGEGPGETFEGMTTLAALAGADVAHPPRAARGRGDLPAPVGVRRPGADHRPRLARPARAVARRGVVRQGAHRARHPVPVDRRAVRPARGRARDHARACSPARSCPTTARSCRCEDAQLRPPPVQQPHPPIWIGGSGPRAHAAARRPLRRRVAHVGHAQLAARGERPASTSSPTEAGRDPASIMRASSLSLDDLDTARKHAAKWRDAGYGYLVCGWPERRPRRRSRRSPARSCPTSPTDVSPPAGVNSRCSCVRPRRMYVGTYW